MSGGTITSDFAMLTAQLLERLGELVIFSNENARLFSTNRQVRWVWIKLQDSEKLQMDFHIAKGFKMVIKNVGSSKT